MAAVFQVHAGALSVATLILVLCVFQSYAWVATPIRTRVCLTKSTRPNTFLFKSTLDNDDDDDDDGWGEEGRDIPEELARIQASPSKATQQEPERDLFIPIFAVVSLLGLFGSYGYEMMRLSSRGELYLPWN